MPEGPEVRRHADALNTALCEQPVVQISARLRVAKAWLQEHPETLIGRRIERVWSHGKNLIGELEGGFHFVSHLMMWGRWQVLPNEGDIAPDRRERARIVTPNAIAILFSAPVFEIGVGNPYDNFEYLRALGPETLPYDGDFDKSTFIGRLTAPQQRGRTIGAVLLDQTVAAGIGNYLRAEILWECRLDPWRTVAGLSDNDLECLAHVVPLMCRRAYENGGATIEEIERQRMRNDAGLVYIPDREYGTRHAVFRRTNLPCLRCGDTIRQLRQTTRVLDDEEKTRIIYFCPTCQRTSVPLKPPRKRKTSTVVPDDVVP
jgi:DNA-formamidopyrimidine glycosylase